MDAPNVPQVVLFAVPGAFTPTCSSKHLPGFIEKADEFKAKGVDTLACVSVNDAFVMDAWGKSAGIDGKILMLADGSAEFAKVCCLDLLPAAWTQSYDLEMVHLYRIHAGISYRVRCKLRKCFHEGYLYM